MKTKNIKIARMGIQSILRYHGTRGDWWQARLTATSSVSIRFLLWTSFLRLFVWWNKSRKKRSVMPDTWFQAIFRLVFFSGRFLSWLPGYYGVFLRRQLLRDNISTSAIPGDNFTCDRSLIIFNLMILRVKGQGGPQKLVVWCRYSKPSDISRQTHVVRETDVTVALSWPRWRG